MDRLLKCPADNSAVQPYKNGRLHQRRASVRVAEFGKATVMIYILYIIFTLVVYLYIFTNTVIIPMVVCRLIFMIHVLSLDSTPNI